MPVFSYSAIDPDSRRVRGVIRADSTRQARADLFTKGIRTTELTLGEEQQSRVRHRPFAMLSSRLLALRQRDQILDLFENLLTLLESFVPLDEAWESLVKKGKGGRQRVPAVIHQLHDGVQLGRPMWTVMEGFPQHFDAADMALIKAGEEAGELAAAISRFVVRRQMAGKLLSTFAGALAYPTFLLVFGSTVVLFLTMKVLPNLNAMLVAAGGEVPWPTKALIFAGHVIGFGLLPAIFALLLIVVLVNRRNDRMRQLVVERALRIPIVGVAWHNWQLAQFCLVLRTLVASGIHLPVALVLAGQSTGEGPVARAAVALRDQLLEGHDMDSPKGDTQISEEMKIENKSSSREENSFGFPAWLWRALSVGQTSGNLVPVLERVGQRFELAAQRSAARLAAVLEPTMILIIGVIVGMIAYGAMLPIIRLGAIR